MQKIAFIFPGQGSQTVGMGLELYKNHVKAKEVIDAVDEALNQKLSKIIFYGDDEQLKLTSNTLPALMVVSIALVRVLEHELGKKLAEAWMKRDLIEVKSTDFPKNRKESHLIQKEFHKVLNKKTVGWKIGMVTKSLQDGAKVDGPMIGKIIDETVLVNPLRIDYGRVPHCILECEFALKFLEDTKMIPGAENKKGNYEIYVSLELVSTRVSPESKKKFKR